MAEACDEMKSGDVHENENERAESPLPCGIADVDMLFSDCDDTDESGFALDDEQAARIHQVHQQTGQAHESPHPHPHRSPHRIVLVEMHDSPARHDISGPSSLSGSRPDSGNGSKQGNVSSRRNVPVVSIDTTEAALGDVWAANNDKQSTPDEELLTPPGGQFFHRVSFGSQAEM